MRLLLDTHIWLWALANPDRLTSRARDAVADEANELWLSSISVWEAHLLAERGRIRFDAPAGEWIERELTRFPLRDAPVSRAIALASRTVRLPHDDPADRFIVATAVVEDLQLVTADARILGSRACRMLNTPPHA